MMFADLHSSAAALGFADFGAAKAAPLGQPVRERLERYLAEGRNASMAYMAANLEKRLDPAALVPGAQSIFCFLVPYSRHRSAKIASYAFGKDYHKVVKDRIHLFMQQNAAALEKQCGGPLQYRVFCDSAPLMEREWAVRCGLGFWGCNNFLISPLAGLRTFIGVAVCNVPFEVVDCEELRVKKASLPAACGSCGACLRNCPSGALEAPFRIDARRCISYLTIEAEEKPQAGCEGLHGRLFGCDACLEACRWNKDLPGWEEFSIHSGQLQDENILKLDDIPQEILDDSAISRALKPKKC